MSRRSFALSILALITLIGFNTGPVGVAQEGPGGAEQPFTGVFLTIVKRSDASSTIELEKVTVRKLDGRSFLVGTGSDTPDNWKKGKTVWVALDDVSDLTLFATLDEQRKAGQLPDGPGADVPPRKDGLR